MKWRPSKGSLYANSAVWIEDRSIYSGGIDEYEAGA